MKYLAWVDYGYDGWSLEECDSFEEAIRSCAARGMSGSGIKITSTDLLPSAGVPDTEAARTRAEAQRIWFAPDTARDGYAFSQACAALVQRLATQEVIL